LTPPKFPADSPPPPARLPGPPQSPVTPGEPGPAAAPVPSLTIDALGRKCPIPIIMLAERIREVPVGHVVAVLADDPAAESDVPAWCMLKSQEFVTMTDLPAAGWAFLVRRSY
jgi:tRNA 2-thiouridine synthesizing protein A